MNISNATYMPVYMRWDTFTFPIKPGTPVSQSGVFSDNSNAVGLVAQTVNEKPLFGSLLILIGGEVDGKSMEYSISDEAKDALNGIRIFEKGKADEPSHYTLPAASASKIGGVKMAENVAVAAGDAPTKAEFDALISSLISAGVMAAPEE